MSSILGYSSTISEGNSANDTIRAVNRQIDAQNSLARDNFNSLRQQEKENKAVAQNNLEQTKTGDREDEGEEGGKLMSSVNDLVAQRNKSNVVKDEADTSPDEVDTENRPIDEGGNGAREVSGEEAGAKILDNRFPSTQALLPEGQLTDLVREKTDFDSDRLNTIREDGRVFPSGESGSNYTIRAYPVNEGRPAGVSDMIRPIEDNVNVPDAPLVAGEVKDTAKNIFQKAGTEGGFLGEGVSGLLKGATIATGGYDAVKDIVDPKSFSKLDTADKVSNVANVISGGLETAGLGLEATGVGAPLGALIQGAGLISGAVGLGAGLIGDITGEKKQSANVSKMPTISPSAQAPQQQKIAYQSSFGGGQLVQ
jgi:hypothetical protein